MLLFLLLATLAGSFFRPPTFLGTGPTPSQGFETLHEQAPATTLSATATALGGADFELLDDPDGERIAPNLDLYAWYATNPDASGTNANPAPAPLPEDGVPESSAPDTDPLEGTGAQ